MAWVFDIAITEGAVAATSTGPANMPDHVANDMLICFANKDSSGALTENSSSSWTALSNGEVAGNGLWVGAWYKRASGTTETAPSFALPNSQEYNILVVTVRGAHTSTNPTSAASASDNTMAGGGYLQNASYTAPSDNSLILFGAGTDSGQGIEPMPGYGQVLYAGDSSANGCGVWWQFFKTSSTNVQNYRYFGAVADDSIAIVVGVPDDGNNTYEPGRIDLTSTFHSLYGGAWGGTTVTAPDTTWTLPASNSITMLGSDFAKVWTFDGVATWVDETEDARDDGTGDVVITNNNNTTIYFGSNTTFNSLCIDVGTAAVGASVGTWEYSTGGGAWSTLTVVDRPNVASWASTWLVAGLGTVTFTVPSNWAKNVVNTDPGDGFYYVRRVVSDNWATSGPTLDQVLKDGRPLVYDASTGTVDSGINPYHLSYSATPAAGGASSYLQHSGGEYVASVALGDSTGVFGIPDWSSGYLLTSFMLQLPRDLIDLGFYDLHKGAAITLMDTGVSARNMTSNSSSTDANTYTTASVAMKSGRLYLMGVENSHGSSATAVSAITATGGGAPTFTSRSTTQFNTNLNRVSIWSCIPGSNYTGTLDIAFGGTTQTGAAWSLNEFKNVDAASNDGIVQNAVGTGTSVTPLATLGAFSSLYNATVGAFGVAAANAGTPSAGYTELTDVTASTPAQALQVVSRFDNDTTVDETITSAAWGACAVEIKTVTTTSNNRTSWICGSKDSPDQVAAKRKVVGIQPSQTIDTAWARHGTLTTSAVDTFIGSSSAPFGATAANWSILMKAGNHILAGGTSASPLTLEQTTAALVNGSQLFPVWDVNGDVVDIWHPTQFGGGDDLHIFCDLKVFQFPERASETEKTTRWHVDDDQVGFDFNGQSGDTIKFTNCLFTGVTPYYWRFNASANSGATWDLSGSTVVGATVTLRSVYTFTTLIFNNCSEITLNGADITSSTIRDTRATTSQGAVAIVSTAECSGLTSLTFINNNDGDIGHSIRITTAAGSYAFSGHTFTGGGPTHFAFLTRTDVDPDTDVITEASHGYATGDAIYYQDQGGTPDIGLSDGTLYYVRAVSSSTLAFYTTKANAQADTSRIALSDGATDQTHYIYSAEADVFVDVAGTTTITITNSTDIPTIRARDGATVKVILSVTVALTVVDENNAAVANVQVYFQKSATGKNWNYTSDTGNSAGDADFVVNETLDLDLPQTGWVHVWDASTNLKQNYRYASWTGKTFTFPTEVTGSATSAGTSTLLNSTGIGALNIQEGDTIRNTTDGSWAIVDELSTNSATTTELTGGSDNTWQNSDAFSVHKLAVAYTDVDDLVDIPIFNGQTNGSGQITTTYDYNAYSTSLPVTIRVRSNTGATKYVPLTTSGTITSAGYSGTIVLTQDTVAT